MSTKATEPTELSPAEWLGQIGELQAARTEARGKVADAELSLSEVTLDHRMGRPGAEERLADLRRGLDENTRAAADLDLAIGAAESHLQRAQHREALANWNRLQASIQREAGTRLKAASQLSDLVVQMHTMLVTTEESGRRLHGYLKQAKDLDPGSMNTASIAPDLYGGGLHARLLRAFEDLLAQPFGYAKHPMSNSLTFVEMETRVNERLLADLKGPPADATDAQGGGPASSKPLRVA